jgi:hypothetical protein
MSIRVMSRTWDACPFEGRKLLIMLALCDYADDEGYCWPKMKQVATKARCSENYARRCIRDFEKEGWLTTTEHRGSGHQNEYQIHENPTSVLVSKTQPQSTQNPTSEQIPGHYKEPSLLPSGKTDENEHTKPATVSSVADADPTASPHSPPASSGVLNSHGENENPHLSNQVIKRKMLADDARDWEVDRVRKSPNPTESYYEWQRTRTVPDRGNVVTHPKQTTLDEKRAKAFKAIDDWFGNDA